MSEKGLLVAGETFQIQDSPVGELTELLQAMRAGDSGAIDDAENEVWGSSR